MRNRRDTLCEIGGGEAGLRARETRMTSGDSTRPPILIAAILAALWVAGPAAAQTPPPKYPDYPSEMPDKFQPTSEGFDYAKREVMIPMRDGVKLYTVILVPTGARGAPILLTRTPYDAAALTNHSQSSHLGPSLSGYDNATDVIVEGGYIRVVQDVRGKHGSEGDYVMNRPLHGPQNPTPKPPCPNHETTSLEFFSVSLCF